MKKKLIILLLALIVAAFTGCGGGGIIVIVGDDDASINDGNDGSDGSDDSGVGGGIDREKFAIVLTSPAPASAEVDVNAAITMTFAESMDQSSVEEAFELIDVSSGEWVEGEYEWLGSSTMIFTPLVPLAYSTIYLVHLQGDLSFASETDPSGEFMSINIEYSFTTRSPSITPPEEESLNPPEEESISPISIIDIVPEAGAMDVSILAEIEVVFDDAVDPDLIAFSLSAENAVEGFISWSDGNSVLIFTPDAALAYDTQYSINVSGAELESSVLSSFITESAPLPQVELVNPADGEEGVSIAMSVEIQFSTSMDTESVEADFMLIRRLGSRQVMGTFAWFDGDSRMVFTPDSELQKNKWHDVAIAVVDFSSSFKTAN